MFLLFLSSSSFSSPPSCPPPCIVYAWVRHVCALMCACVWRPEEGEYQCFCCCSPYFLETKSSHRARARLTGPNMQVNLLTPPMCSNPQCRVRGVCDYAQILHGAGDPNSCRHVFRASTMALSAVSPAQRLTLKGLGCWGKRVRIPLGWFLERKRTGRFPAVLERVGGILL